MLTSETKRRIQACRNLLVGKLPMMTTGYDCEDVLNVVLARPIFSATDFIQIKGRGTRLFTFKHDATGKSAPKEGFALFDFFANCEFFEREFDYDEKLKLPKGLPPTGPGGEDGDTGGGGGAAGPETYTNTSPDPLKDLTAEAVGLDGMKIDREMYRERFAAEARGLPELQQAVAAGDWAGAEAVFNQMLADKPKEFWNLPKLHAVFRTDRNPSFREILQYIFGLTPEIADRAHLATEYFERYLATQPVEATKIRETRQVFHAFVLDGEVRRLIEQGNYAEVRAHDAGLFQSIKTLGAEGMPSLLAYIRASVPLDDFVRVA